MAYLETKPFLADSTECSDEWAVRSAFWLAKTDTSAKPRRRRDRNTKPLVLCGHGASLRIQSGALVIRDGFTHHPQAQVTHQFFPGDLALPTRIILVDGSGTLSFDVLSWLSVQGVTLVRVNWNGEVASVLSVQGYGADRQKVQRQIDIRADDARRMAVCLDLIACKIAASLNTVLAVVPESLDRDRVCERLRGELDILKKSPPTDVGGLRGIEGRASATYFAAWRHIPFQWKSTARNPVPDAWLRFGPRSSIRSGKAKNEKASHPINAMLNYAYAILQSRVQIDILSEGYDPQIGIMHHSDKGSPAFAFDLMEPSRPIVDAAILKFATETTLTGADFTLRRDGIVRVGPQLARRVVAISSEIDTVGKIGVDRFAALSRGGQRERPLNLTPSPFSAADMNSTPPFSSAVSTALSVLSRESTCPRSNRVRALSDTMARSANSC